VISDEALLQQARKGGEEAFAGLYDRYKGPLYAFAFRLTGSGPEAEDVVHDSLIGVLRPESAFDGNRGSLRSYLYAAVRNLARKQYRGSRLEDSDGAIEDAAGDDSPLVALITAETARQVQAAVAALPDLQREVLVLSEYEGMPLAEIAALVEADVGTVKSRLHRARQRLRRTLRPAAAPVKEL
jgi:RNA polymerase sigma-70 factor (ECF subfamily)